MRSSKECLRPPLKPPTEDFESFSVISHRTEQTRRNIAYLSNPLPRSAVCIRSHLERAVDWRQRMIGFHTLSLSSQSAHSRAMASLLIDPMFIEVSA